LAEEFEPSDWESLGIGEEDLIGDFADAANLAR
jgi:hypothetical protein